VLELLYGGVWLLIWLAVALPAGYLYFLALAAIRVPGTAVREHPATRFALVVPAHNEESVIAHTVASLKAISYPPDRFEIHVIADHCSDATAENARAAGARCHERNDGPRGGKGAALAWGFARILGRPGTPGAAACDAVVVFDADTRADPQFLAMMDARLAAGDRAVQGQHRIINPDDSWYARLAWVMMTIQNRVMNQGRNNLGLSAANMGDSICVAASLLRDTGWGEGLTEDYDLRLLLLAKGVHIAYEPAAIGNGEAPVSWAIARRQRERWLAGTYNSSRNRRRDLFRLARDTGDPAAWDAILQTLLPAYSTMILVGVAASLAQALLAMATGRAWGMPWPVLWGVAIAALFAFPFVGLLMAGAPPKAYLVVWLGPFFVLWRTWLALTSRFLRRPGEWVRTPRRQQP
jgi:cellulose synthase/poly-beta-1,6-N-acetylglucosamine synthase-like glycosyltransferase